MESTSIFPPLCIVCLKPVTTAKLESNSQLILFFKLWSEFVGTDYHNNYSPFCNAQLFDYCENCFSVMNQFCELFQQLKLVELKLKWKLENVINIMKLAGKVPSRVVGLQKVLIKYTKNCKGSRLEPNQNNTFQFFKKFRFDFIEKSNLRRLRGQPRVLLKTIPNSESKPSNEILSLNLNSAPSPTQGNAEILQNVSQSQAESDYLPTDETLNTTISNSVKYETSWDDVVAENSVHSSYINDSIDSATVLNYDDNQVITNQDSGGKLILPKNDPWDNTSSGTSHTKAVKNQTWTKTKKRVAKLNNINKPTRPTSKIKQSYKCGYCNTFYRSFKHLKLHKLTSRKHKTKFAKARTNNVLHAKAKFNNLRYFESQLSTLLSKDNLPQASKKYNFRERKTQNKHCDKIPESEWYSEDDNKSLQSNVSSFYDSASSHEIETSESESVEVKVEAVNLKTGISKTNKKRGKQTKLLYCEAIGCPKHFSNRLAFVEHKKLHQTDNFYYCNFCEIKTSNVMALANHEFKCHTDRNPKSDIYHCARCSYKRISQLKYYEHFADFHMGVFDSKVGRMFTECHICMICLRTCDAEKHNKMYHDVNNVSSEKILKCTVTGCTAYFVTANRASESSTSTNCLESVWTKHKNYHKKIGESTKTKLKCHFCETTYTSIKHLRDHMETYHAPGKIREKVSNRKHVDNSCKDKPKKHHTFYVCPVLQCTQYYHTKEQLEAHQTHHGQFPCSLCNEIKVYAPDLASHVLEKHSKPNGKIVCVSCGYKCKRDKTYVHHYMTKHMNLRSPKVVCQICKEEFMNVQNLELHIDKKHKIEEGAVLHKCNQCPAYFTSKLFLVTHQTRAHLQNFAIKPRLCTCPVCKKVYSNPRLLRNHASVHHPELDLYENFKFQCENLNCGAKYCNKADLDRHKTKCNAYICSKCGKKFKNENMLNNHEQRVHGEARFFCNTCDKGFTTRQSLKHHMEFHKSPTEWEWQCSVCGRKFASKQKLEQHGRTHTKEKPYICQYCGVSYAHRHNWRNHLKSKHADTEHGVQNINEGTESQGNYMCRKGSKKGECILSGSTKQ